jgi:hypothetical protein
MSTRRVKILSKSEINELYGLPELSSQEKQSYFSLTQEELTIIDARGSLESKVHFILQLGYFKAATQFFNCTFHEVKHDTKYILKTHFKGFYADSPHFAYLAKF